MKNFNKVFNQTNPIGHTLTVHSASVRRRHSYMVQRVTPGGNLLSITFLTLVGGQEVSVTLEPSGFIHPGCCYISFEIDGQYEFSKGPWKVTITRWLLEIWQLVKEEMSEYKAYICDAYDEDNRGAERTEWYTSLGFIPLDEDELIYNI